MGSQGVGDKVWHGVVVVVVAERSVPHSGVVDKIVRDTLGMSNPSLTSGHTTQDFSTGMIKPHNFWLEKPMGLMVVGETAGFAGEFD